MNPEQFTYWLQGFFELRALDPSMKDAPLLPEQVRMIQEHLALVFTKVTSSGDGSPVIDLEHWPAKRSAPSFCMSGLIC